MQKLKKLLPLWVAFGILLVVSGIVFGLDRLQQQNARKNAAPVIVPLEDGVWKLYPEREPEQIYEWQGEEHFIVSGPGHLAFFDGGDIWIYEYKSEELLSLAKDQPVDQQLGAAGAISVRSYKRGSVDGINYIKTRYYAIFLHADSQRMEQPSWSDEPVSVWTASMVGSDRTQQTFDLPIAPQINWDFSFNDSTNDVDTITQRADGKVRTVSTNLSHNSSRPRSQWFTATQEQRISPLHDSYSVTTTTTDSIEWQRNEYGYPQETHTKARKSHFALRFPHRYTDEPYDLFYFLSPTGSLYYHSMHGNECIDRFSDIDESAFASALISDQYFALPDASGTRVYAWFQGYEWAKFDIPVSAD